MLIVHYVRTFFTQDTYKGNPWQPWTQNRYTYVSNSPTHYTDPAGHCLEDLCIGEAALVATVLVPAAEEYGPEVVAEGEELLTAGEQLAANDTV